MQLKQFIDRLADIRQKHAMMTAQYKDVLKQMKDLEKDEKKGLDKLNEAARQMEKTGNFVSESEKALIEFNAKIQNKRPGIKQMLARPEEVKFGEKAGDYFGRLAARLEADVMAIVEEEWENCKEDLTHAARCVSKIKLVVKSSSIPPEVMKTAGIVDVVISVKEWLAGKARRLFDIVGDVGRWLKGFVERGKRVGKANAQLKKVLDTTIKDVDKALAAA